jgi:hypothetical protein
MIRKFEYTVLELLDNSMRVMKAMPMNLGGVSGAGGGTGFPPGGFIGQLPQTKVAYDTTEAATLFTPMSGMSLLDNLNHIRYRIGVIESGGTLSPLAVEDWDGSPSITNVSRIIFSGATITNQGYGRALVTILASGGSGSPITVVEADGSPSVSNVDQITFSGLSVVDQGSGDAFVYIEPQRQGVATMRVYYPVADGFNLESGMGYYGLYKEPHGTASSISSGTLTGPTTELASSITPPGEPGAFAMGEGVYVFTIRARRLSGTKNVKLKGRIYTRTVGGTETLIAESNETPNLTGSYANYTVVARADAVILAPTDRIVVKYAATPYDAGTNPTAQIDFNNSNGYTRVEMPSNLQDVHFLRTGGWILRPETWTRTGDHTFTMAGDWTSIYRKGVRVRYYDGATDYGTIRLSSHSAGTTTITLASNTDYAMAATTIFNRYISFDADPEGFPDFFNFSVTGIASNTGTVTLTATSICKFKPMLTGMIDCVVQWTGTITVAAPNQIVWDLPVPVLDSSSYPVTAATLDTTASTVVALGAANGNSVLGAANRCQIRKADFTNWGIAAGKIFQWHGVYPY